MVKRYRAMVAAAWVFLLILGIAAGVATQRLWQMREELEDLAGRLTLAVGPESTLIYDAKDNLVAAVFEEHRIGVRLEDLSPHLINAVLVTEDRRFFSHGGVDLRRIVAALAANSRAGTIVQGGSTITQQLVRSILLSREQTYSRKFKEAILARRLEERYSKHDILQSYLNRVYFGDGYYGVEAAAIGYFGKSVRDLTAVESATLAGLIKGPSLYSPTKNPDACRQRRDIVLEEMHGEGMVSDQELSSARSVPVQTLRAQADKTGVPDPRHAHGAEYFRDAVSKELIERFGSEAVYTGGLRVYTTLDRDMQRLAEEVIATRVNGLSNSVEPLQGALVAIDPRTGHVKAIVGGRSFHESPYNRATEARRQPGSAFKPFIYAMALESGLSPGSQLHDLDQPIQTYKGPWLPSGEHEQPSTTLRSALALSSNWAAAHLLQEVGIHRTLDLVQRFGIGSPMPAVPAVALGTGEVTLYELTSAYGVFANHGTWRTPTMIRRVTDSFGREIYSTPDAERRVISEGTAYMMASMMSDVIDYGTAASARSQGFRMRAAGKTGTSQDYTDAWFVGFTRTLVTGVWFGYDKPRPIMNRGFAGVVAVPAWTRFMNSALHGVDEGWFDMPDSLVKVKICRLSGLLASDQCNLPVYESAPFDPNYPEWTSTSSGIMRDGGVFEDVRPADRVPPPCTLPHGVPSPSMTDRPTPRVTTVSPIIPTAPAPPDPVTRPPDTIANPLMPAETSRTDSSEKAKPESAEKPKPETEAENPIIPRGAVKSPPPADPPADAPIIPGARMDKAPPKPPKPPGV